VDTLRRGTAPGYVFFAPKKKVTQMGPLIVDDHGDVVWFKPLGRDEASDFRMQRYRGRPVLTWWQGRSKFGIGQGAGMIYDSSYRKLAEVHAGHGFEADLHEFRLTPRSTALITIYHRVPADLSALGGPKHGFVQDSVVQEVAVPSGRVVFEWHSYPGVPLSESYAPLRKVKVKGKSVVTPYDYFHVNSVALDGHGNYLISGRNTRALYDLAPDGRILWRLGGKRSDLEMAPGTRFAWQHDAELHPGGTLTLFDNEAMPNVGDHSRALVLHVDFAGRTVRLVRVYVHPKELLAPHQGDVQLLPDGHLFVGWGGLPYMTEFARDGTVLFDATFGKGADSYRAYRFVWHGRPRDRPRAAVRDAGNGRVDVYASWNGATKVTSWDVRTASAATVAHAPRTGFETKVEVRSSARSFAVQALDRSGRVLGTSLLVRR
jgi:hypothetical protein